MFIDSHGESMDSRFFESQTNKSSCNNNGTSRFFWNRCNAVCNDVSVGRGDLYLNFFGMLDLSKLAVRSNRVRRVSLSLMFLKFQRMCGNSNKSEFIVYFTSYIFANY